MNSPSLTENERLSTAWKLPNVLDRCSTLRTTPALPLAEASRDRAGSGLPFCRTERWVFAAGIFCSTSIRRRLVVQENALARQSSTPITPLASDASRSLGALRSNRFPPRIPVIKWRPPGQLRSELFVVVIKIRFDV